MKARNVTLDMNSGCNPRDIRRNITATETNLPDLAMKRGILLRGKKYLRFCKARALTRLTFAARPFGIYSCDLKRIKMQSLNSDSLIYGRKGMENRKWSCTFGI